MNPTDTLTTTDMAIRAWSILEGEDDYTMGDPGPMGTVGKARAALDTLFACSATIYAEDAPSAWDPASVQSKVGSEVDARCVELLAQARPAHEQKILEQVAALPLAAKPVEKMTIAELSTLAGELYEKVTQDGHRLGNIAHDYARDEIVTGYIKQILKQERGIRNDLRRDLTAFVRGIEKGMRAMAPTLGL